MMIDFILIALTIVTCVVASITDIKYSKIYNKHLIINFTLGIILYLMKFIAGFKLVNSIPTCCIEKWMINILVGLIISLCFYFFKIWSAGDAKLFILILFLIPYYVYFTKQNSIFPGYIILIYIFSIAFIYLGIETIVLKIKESRASFNSIIIKNIFDYINKNKNKIISSLIEATIRFVFFYLFIFNLDFIIIRYFNNFYIDNASLFVLFNAFIVSIIAKLISNKRIYYILYIITVLSTLTVILSTKLLRIESGFNLNVFAIVFIVMFIRYIAESYNYKVIPTSEIKHGDILAKEVFILFQFSKIKGLPTYKSETTKARLKEKEVESIKRWEKSKYGSEFIKIVKVLPFAPFISGGLLLYLLLSLYIRA